MIRYTLVCEQEHSFESWFKDSDAFDDQAARGLVSCPTCGSAKVAKAIMAPSVARRDKERRPVVVAEQPQAAAQPAAPAAVTLLSEKEQQLREMLRALRQQVVENAAYVGDQFAEEARRIHSGEAEERAIYGEATREDVHELLEDGIEVLPLPPAPEQGN
jgi:hypothetical protein